MSSGPLEETSAPNKLHGFIDAHVHVWTDDTNLYPISPPFTPNDMNPRVATPERILQQAQASGVARAVLVQMSYYGCDNSYMLDVIGRSNGVFAGIAVIDWTQADPEQQVLQLAKRGVRGFRICAEVPAAAAQLTSERLDKMFRCGQQERLAMCFLILPEGLKAVARCCERFPDTPVIIDHLAQIGTDGIFRSEHVQTLCALSKYPEVKVKLSGFYALGAKRPPHDELAPLIRQVYDAFGPKRLMWGSDWPFQVAQEKYEDSISLIRARLDFLAPDDKEWILRKASELVFFA